MKNPLKNFESISVDDKMFLEQRAPSIPGTYFRKFSIWGTFYRQLHLIQNFSMRVRERFAKEILFDIGKQIRISYSWNWLSIINKRLPIHVHQGCIEFDTAL